MGKNASQTKKRKRQQLSTTQYAQAKRTSPPSLPTPRYSSASPDTLIAPEDMAITVDVLRTLAEHPSELVDTSMKALKSATYDLHRVMAEGSALGLSIPSLPHRTPS